MQRLKEPKTFNRPRLYYQPGCTLEDDCTDDRLRIIYPNGDTSYMQVRYHPWDLKNFGFTTLNKIVKRFDRKPCWRQHTMEWAGPIPKSARQQLLAMRKFDRGEGYKRAWFLGEL
jgi:hypothetical protein